jgi:quinol monooxygenase YgiN
VALAVAVTWHARAGAEARLEAILGELAAVTRVEPGCLTYQPHRAADGAGVFFIYEQFVDEAAFNAHLESEYYRRLVLDEAVALLEHRERSVYSTVDAG